MTDCPNKAIIVGAGPAGCEKKFDVWAVNEDAQYHESGEAGAESQHTGQEAEVSAAR
jgi:hypothetical protein